MIGKDIQLAAAYLEQGKLVAIPTETVYGLAARIDRDESVLEIFKAKNRPAFDPLIVHIADISWLNELVAEIPEKAERLMKKVWPGPLTLLFKKSDKVSDLVTSGNDTVAIRMPGHPLTLEMLRLLGLPVAAPSANPFGYVSPTTAAHVDKQLGEQVAYILDGGPSTVGLESTILSFVENKPKVLRLGGMSIEQLSELLGETPELQIATHSNPQAPGQLDKHYATGIPLIFTEDVLGEAKKHSGERLGLIAFQSDYDAVPWTEKEVLSQEGNLNEAARKLFSVMRSFDEKSLDKIIAEKFPNQGLGRAINDRLQRASHR
ncbi:MAG: threonylcarbamoyl-AMP synthase [Bacteroidota bacterium]|nr:threonylcarbamoyl-AMP synthase [Bacteroidota bacterium]MDX5429654.1 threonylcarbamoyl-AMP synthase [Bacteroidota bacterium]MDX5468435.1 threonylcarbamoyl-AMP synthase [Bacteroidota bacterium]